MAITQGQLISASDFQLKTIASLTKTQSFSVAYGSSATITLGTFTIPANTYFVTSKAMCTMSGGSPSTWQATVHVGIGAAPRDTSTQNNCSWTGTSSTSISHTAYSEGSSGELLTNNNPPQRIARFSMPTSGGDIHASVWQLKPGTTYTVTASVSQSDSRSYSYSNVTFTFKLWLY